MSDRYSSLSQMGIQNPEQIEAYDLVEVSDREDMLRVRYTRPKGSFLPVTRHYRFHRTAKPNRSDDIGNQPLIQYEIAPLLDSALRELDKIVRPQSGRDALILDLENKLRCLDEDLHAEIASVKETVAALKKIG